MATYTTKQGDTWDLIAYEQLGSEWFADKLISKNFFYSDQVIFSAGITLELPEITEEEKNNAQADLPPWRLWETED